MEKNLKDKLIEESKNNMPELWEKIENKLEPKKNSNKKKVLGFVASMAVILGISIMLKNHLSTNEIIALDSNEEEYSEENNIEKNQLAVNDDLGNVNEENKYYDKIDKIEVLEDLDLQNIIEGNIVLNLGIENSYSVDPNSINYMELSNNIVYGKITKVKSYVKFGSMIFSDMTIEVINDYKGGFSKGGTFIMGAHGGEMTYDEYISQIEPMRVEKFGYDKIKDKSKMFIELWDGVPMYREGEYVLVYVGSLDNDEYYKEHPELRAQESYDYGIYKRLYVDPNSREVFNYKYNINNTLEKVKVGMLDNIEEIDFSRDLE